jgi:hypothetical protein
MPRLPLPVLAIAFLLLGSNEALSSSCPPDTVNDVITTAAAFDSIWTLTANDTTYASYDLRAGDLVTRHATYYVWPVHSRIRAWDEYMATSSSQSSGTIPLRLQVLIDGIGTGDGSSFHAMTLFARATNDDHTLFEEYHYSWMPKLWSRVYNLELSVPLGVPFHLGFEVDAFSSFVGGPSGPGYVHMHFGFGFPPDVTMSSCQGYFQDQPVPAQATTWGSVKARYR